MVCDKVVCERWCVTKLCNKDGLVKDGASKMVCKDCVSKMVCQRWCVTKWCERWCVTKRCDKEGV